MKALWRNAAILLAVAFAVALAWGLGQMRAREDAERMLSAQYQQAFFAAVDHVENVEVLLSKALVASTPEQVAQIFSDLREQAWAAQASLNRLPLLQGTLMRTSKFLTQVGDFGFSVARKAAQGVPPDGDTQELIRAMKDEARVLSAALGEIRREASGGPMPWEEVRRRANRTLREESKQLDESFFARLDQHFEQIPVIQYDGPFSDHILQREPKGLTGPEITEAQAEEAALSFAPLEGREDFEAVVTRRVRGEIEAYGVELRRRGSEDPVFVLDVAVKGGHVVWMLDREPASETKIRLEDAVERAKEFLEARGYENMVPTHAAFSDHRAVIPFVPEVDGVLIYPDLVKVSVNMETGKVAGFEALGYLMSHTERQLGRPKLSAAQALERVGGELDVRGEPRLALIPLETLEEVLTWEVEATLDGERFLIYVNAENGDQERILRLVETEEGEKTL